MMQHVADWRNLMTCRTVFSSAISHFQPQAAPKEGVVQVQVGAECSKPVLTSAKLISSHFNGWSLSSSFWAYHHDGFHLKRSIEISRWILKLPATNTCGYVGSYQVQTWCLFPKFLRLVGWLRRMVEPLRSNQQIERSIQVSEVPVVFISFTLFSVRMDCCLKGRGVLFHPRC